MAPKAVIGYLLILVAPYLALGQLGSIGMQIIAEILGEEAADSLRKALGVRRIHEKDVKDMFRIIEGNEELMRYLLDLLRGLLERGYLDGLGKGELEKLMEGLKELGEKYPELEDRVKSLKVKVRELEERVSLLEKEQAVMKARIEDHEVRVKGLEEQMSVIELNFDNLIGELGLGWVRKRGPVISSKIREKVKEVVKWVDRALKKGESLKVAVLGEAGVGKTTFLYLVVRHLLRSGVKVYKGLSQGYGVYILDNLPRMSEGLKDATRMSNGVIIAAGRSSEWKLAGLYGWRKVEITKEDHRPVAKEMLISALKAEGVSYEERALEVVLDKAPPVPVYFASLAEWLSERGAMLTEEEALKVPVGVYEVISDTVDYMACRDELAVAILYALAETRTGWLHREQISLLRRKLSKFFDGNGECEGLLQDFSESYGLRHDAWAIVLKESWISLKVGREEPEALKRVRSYNVLPLVKEACKDSFNLLNVLGSDHSAAELVMRALDNFPELGVEVAEIVLPMKGYRRDLVLDMVALRSPGSLIEAVKGFEEAEKLALELKDAPSAEAELFSYVVDEYRRLAERDERFLPDLARTLNGLGEALSRKGRLDEAIASFEEALSIYRRLAERDERFLPDLARTLNGLGEALSRKGRLDEAIDTYRQGVGLLSPLISLKPWYFPLLSNLYLNLSLALLSKGDIREAIFHLCKSLYLLTYPSTPKTAYSRKLLEKTLEHLNKLKDKLPRNCPEKLNSL